MSNEPDHAQHSTNSGYERRDIGVAGVLYFLAGLAVFGLITNFVVTGVYHYFENRTEAQQTPVNPLVTNAVRDTRHLPPEYNGNYDKYLQKNFPSPQLEIDERHQLDQIRLNEEQTLNTYGYVDQKAGVVRIPIDRAMDLIAQRGLPVRTQAPAGAAPHAAGSAAQSTTKGTKQ
jgi:hypothetical protein